MMLKNIMGKNRTAAEGFAKVRDMERNSLQQIDALEKHRAELMQQQIEGRLKAEEEGRAFGGDVLEKLFRVESELTAERQYCNALCQRKIEQISAVYFAGFVAAMRMIGEEEMAIDLDYLAYSRRHKEAS